ncbi:HEPN domain-containing protein [Treponema sp. OMZ 799]|uniref:HEPN domain-containing protein n=1 Tax=Treponema sp. OMZ 799 TaxID=2563668 RepID=UPI0020A5D533|nr:HEPN domain-containing protein [Treponema sp. OMZ 799]UTC78963.1 HEPN domain-containing protein [Treponema sp. OMZ 799]
MKNEIDVKEWIRYADMDVLAANHLNGIQYPKPLEIICYHCRQAAEKMLKALIIAYDGELQKTHDLGLLTDELSEFVTFSENILNSVDALTPYGVKIRYPQELNIEESHVAKAISDMKTVYDFVKNKMEELKLSPPVEELNKENSV